MKIIIFLPFLILLLASSSQADVFSDFNSEVDRILAESEADFEQVRHSVDTSGQLTPYDQVDHGAQLCPNPIDGRLVPCSNVPQGGVYGGDAKPKDTTLKVGSDVLGCMVGGGCKKP